VAKNEAVLAKEADTAFTAHDEVKLGLSNITSSKK
jgi:hypothetical protein